MFYNTILRSLQKSSKSYHYTANFASINAKFSVDGWADANLRSASQPSLFLSFQSRKPSKLEKNSIKSGVYGNSTAGSRAHAATKRTLLQQKTKAPLRLYESRNPGKIPERFCNTLTNSIFMHFDIVEVVDSSSTTPTILHQAKPLETSSFPTVFLYTRKAMTRSE